MIGIAIAIIFSGVFLVSTIRKVYLTLFLAVPGFPDRAVRGRETFSSSFILAFFARKSANTSRHQKEPFLDQFWMLLMPAAPLMLTNDTIFAWIADSITAFWNFSVC